MAARYSGFGGGPMGGSSGPYGRRAGARGPGFRGRGADYPSSCSEAGDNHPRCDDPYCDCSARPPAYRGPFGANSRDSVDSDLEGFGAGMRQSARYGRGRILRDFDSDEDDIDAGMYNNRPRRPDLSSSMPQRGRFRGDPRERRGYNPFASPFRGDSDSLEGFSDDMRARFPFGPRGVSRRDRSGPRFPRDGDSLYSLGDSPTSSLLSRIFARDNETASLGVSSDDFCQSDRRGGLRRDPFRTRLSRDDDSLEGFSERDFGARRPYGPRGDPRFDNPMRPPRDRRSRGYGSRLDDPYLSEFRR